MLSLSLVKLPKAKVEGKTLRRPGKKGYNTYRKKENAHQLVSQK